MDTPAQSPLRILIVDDLADIVETLSQLLQREGHQVATAKDGASALSLAASFQPDVALLDLVLPEVNGFAVARQLREQVGPKLMIIAVSGWTRNLDRERASEAGFDHYLMKPVDLAALSSLLRTQQQKIQSSQ